MNTASGRRTDADLQSDLVRTRGGTGLRALRLLLLRLDFLHSLDLALQSLAIKPDCVGAGQPGPANLQFQTCALTQPHWICRGDQRLSPQPARRQDRNNQQNGRSHCTLCVDSPNAVPGSNSEPVSKPALIISDSESLELQTLEIEPSSPGPARHGAR